MEPCPNCKGQPEQIVVAGKSAAWMQCAYPGCVNGMVPSLPTPDKVQNAIPQANTEGD